MRNLTQQYREWLSVPSNGRGYHGQDGGGNTPQSSSLLMALMAGALMLAMGGGAFGTSLRT